MPRISVEVETAQLPAGWMWRFIIPPIIAPRDGEQDILAGLTGPFPTEAQALHHATRTLEHLIREQAMAATVPRQRRPSHRGGASWTQDGPAEWSRRHPRVDVELRARVWMYGKQFLWSVTLDGAPVASGSDVDPSAAKTAASAALTQSVTTGGSRR